MTPGRATLADKPVSSLGLGVSSLMAQPRFDEGRSLAIIEAAAEGGINHFDTAPSYGHGEERLGRFLKGRDRDAFVITSKVGTERSADGQRVRSFDPARMRSSLDGTLARLGVERLDVLYLHGPAEQDLNDEVIGFFEEEKARGRILRSGVNSFDAPVVAACAERPIDVVMLQYGLLDRRAEALVDRLDARGKTVVSGTILGQAAFRPATWIPRDRQSLWYLLRLAKNDPLFFRWAFRRPRFEGAEGMEAALAFILSRPKIASGLFGTTSPEHARDNAAAMRRLTAAEAR
jgi:D-threo-aldose 1-dehydrogenase